MIAKNLTKLVRRGTRQKFFSSPARSRAPFRTASLTLSVTIIITTPFILNFAHADLGPEHCPIFGCMDIYPTPKGQYAGNLHFSEFCPSVVTGRPTGVLSLGEYGYSDEGLFTYGESMPEGEGWTRRSGCSESQNGKIVFYTLFENYFNALHPVIYEWGIRKATLHA